MRSNTILKAVNGDLCIGCGICTSACLKDAIAIKTNGARFQPVINDEICIKCGKCIRSCPGLGVNLTSLSESLFSGDGVQSNDYIGRYVQCYIGHSNDKNVRALSSSGGMVSQLLIWLLDNKRIDGALLTVFDKESPLKVRTFIARNKLDVILAKGSKYSPVSLHEGLAQLKKSDSGRYVVVGLPCHVQGIRKLMATDACLRKKIVGIFSLFCSGSQTFNYTHYIIEQCGGKVDSLNYLAYREGSPTGLVAKGEKLNVFKDYVKYNSPLKSTFYPKRCLLCVDMFGELSDISFGDIQIEDSLVSGTGISALVVRNELWNGILKEASSANTISLEAITEETLLNGRKMAFIKKGRNASFIELLKIFHVPTPEYDSKYNGKVTLRIALNYSAKRIKQFIGNHRGLWFLLPKIK